MQLIPREMSRAELRRAARRYEAVRKLTPSMFADVHSANIKGIGRFDDMVDRIADEMENSRWETCQSIVRRVCAG